MRLALIISQADGALGSSIRRMADVEVVQEAPYFNKSLLSRLVSLAPEIAVVSENVLSDGDMTLSQFVFGLRRANIRVIFLADRAKPGDRLLHELVSANVTDIILGGQVRLSELEAMFKRQTPWSEVAHLVIPGETVNVGNLEAISPVGDDDRAVTDRSRPTTTNEGGALDFPVQAPSMTRITAVTGLGGVGAGATTVSVNLAAAFAELRHRVALIDADPSFSGVNVHLGLSEVHAGLQQLLSGVVPARAGEVSSGIRCYGSPMYPNPVKAADLGVDEMVRVVDQLRSEHDHIIIDAGCDFTHPFSRAALQVAGEVLVVVDTNLCHTLVAVHKWPLLERLIGSGKLSLVVNKVEDSSRLARSEAIADSLVGSVRQVFSLPYEPGAADALMAGKPLVQSLSADNPFSVALRQIGGLSAKQRKTKRGWFRR